MKVKIKFQKKQECSSTNFINTKYACVTCKLNVKGVTAKMSLVFDVIPK